MVDGNTLTLVMARPFPEMPHWGSYPAMGPIPERGSDPASYGRHPLATGPYKFADYSPGTSLSLVRNDQWDPATDPGRHQYPDDYEFSFGVPAKQISATILGDSAAAPTTLSINAVAVDHRRARALDRLTLGSAPCTYMVFPDYRKITDIRVRRAIGYAFPYQEDARALRVSSGVTVLPGSSILPPDFPGRQDYDVLETEPGRTDPDKAKALLQEAGYAPGEYELKFPYVISDPSWVERKDRLVTALEAAGFKVTPFPTSTPETNFEVVSDPNAPINLRLNGWCSEWPTGGAWFPQLFHSDGAANQAYFTEPAVDAEIDRISGLSVEQQPAAWGALDKSLMTDYYPAVITSYTGAAMLHGSRIGGMNADSVYTMPTWKDIYLSR